MEAIELVADQHVERRGRRAFLAEAVNVEVRMIGPPVREPVDEPRVAVKGEDHWSIRREQGVELGVR